MQFLIEIEYCKKFLAEHY